MRKPLTPLQDLARLLREHCGKSPEQALKAARRLRRLGFAGQRLEIMECNRAMTEREKQAQLKTQAAFEKLCKRLGLTAHISDPRGYCYFVIFPGGRDAPYNGLCWEDGYAVTKRRGKVKD